MNLNCVQHPIQKQFVNRPGEFQSSNSLFSTVGHSEKVPSSWGSRPLTPSSKRVLGGVCNNRKGINLIAKSSNFRPSLFSGCSTHAKNELVRNMLGFKLEKTPEKHASVLKSRTAICQVGFGFMDGTGHFSSLSVEYGKAPVYIYLDSSTSQRMLNRKHYLFCLTVGMNSSQETKFMT